MPDILTSAIHIPKFEYIAKGKALEVYSRLPPTHASDYDILKESLLKRFQLTEEGFRLKFRNGKPESGESSGQFVARLDNYLMRWMELSGVANTYEGLRDFVTKGAVHTCIE